MCPNAKKLKNICSWLYNSAWWGRHKIAPLVPFNFVCVKKQHAFYTQRHLPSVHLGFWATFVAIQSPQRGPLVHQRCSHFLGKLGKLAVVRGDEARPGGRAGGGKSDQGGGNATCQLKAREAENMTVFILPLNSFSSFGKGNLTQSLAGQGWADFSLVWPTFFLSESLWSTNIF